MSEVTGKALDYLVFVINAAAKAWGVLPRDAYQRVEKSGAISGYLLPCWEVLHTMNTDLVVEDLEEYERRGEQA